MKRRAFTLVEIMIVVLIIGILLSIAVPQWIQARESSRQKTCVSNLRQISDAKDLWAMEFRKNTGDAVVQADLWPGYIKGDAFPACPASGTYTIDVVGNKPACTYLTGKWPHQLN